MTGARASSASNDLVAYQASTVHRPAHPSRHPCLLFSPPKSYPRTNTINHVTHLIRTLAPHLDSSNSGAYTRRNGLSPTYHGGWFILRDACVVAICSAGERRGAGRYRLARGSSILINRPDANKRSKFERALARCRRRGQNTHDTQAGLSPVYTYTLLAYPRHCPYLRRRAVHPPIGHLSADRPRLPFPPLGSSQRTPPPHSSTEDCTPTRSPSSWTTTGGTTLRHATPRRARQGCL